MNYVNLFVTGLAGFNIFRQQGGINERTVKRIIMLWLIAGVIELFYPAFMQVFTPGARTSAARGVTGLAMEPSFYGYTAFFFLIMSLGFETERLKYSAVCIFQIIFLAQSTVGTLYIVVLAGSYFIFSGNIKKKILPSATIILFFSAAIIFVGSNEFMMKYRIVSLTDNLFRSLGSIESLDELYAIDASAGSRMNAIIWGARDFVKDFGLPHGFTYRGRIQSGYGASLYEMGIFGLVMIAAITRRFTRTLGLPISVAMLAVMFSAVQVSSPTFAFMAALAEYKFHSARVRAISP